MAQPMETHEESEEPDPEFIDKLTAFHAQRGSVFPKLNALWSLLQSLFALGLLSISIPESTESQST